MLAHMLYMQKEALYIVLGMPCCYTDLLYMPDHCLVLGTVKQQLAIAPDHDFFHTICSAAEVCHTRLAKFYIVLAFEIH